MFVYNTYIVTIVLQTTLVDLWMWFKLFQVGFKIYLWNEQVDKTVSILISVFNMLTKVLH